MRAFFDKLLPLLLMLTLPAVVQAQFTYTINNGTITITGYTGSGGAVTIPDTINGLPVTSIGRGAFLGCSSLTSVTIPDGVTSIGGYAFTGCNGLTSVSIPNSVTSIGDSAFYSCTSLTSVTIPDGVTSIGGYAFTGCNSLTNVSIPNSVTSIGDSAFYSCTRLTSVTIPSSVTSIGDNAFASCISLIYVMIGTSVTNMGDSAFGGCTSLSAITVDVLNPFYSSVEGILFNKSQTTLIQCPGGKTGSYTIPNSVTSIGDSAFYSCTRLTSVTIPSSVISVGTLAFYSCPSLSAITVDALNPFYSSVEGILFNKSQTTLIQCPGGKTGSYTIPSSVTSIGDNAFYSCISMTNVTIGTSVTSIGHQAFYNCTSLASVWIPNSVTSIGYLAFYSCVSMTIVTIGSSVTNIGDFAFMYCTSLTSVTIPNKVTNIGDQAFICCTNLSAITVDVLNPFYSSVEGILFNKSQTTLIQCPGGKTGSYTIPSSVTSIGYSAFGNCTSLASVSIPNSVTSIPYFAFTHCTSLTSITIPNSVTDIAGSAFESCTSLTSVSLPNSVTSIEYGTFAYCTSLTTFSIPNNVTSIGDWAFGGCTSLTNVTIGNGVTSIGGSAFYDCSSLTALHLSGNAPSLAPDVFTRDDQATVYYLPGTTGWGATFGGRPTALWIQVPTIQTSPQNQTAEAGSAVGLRVKASSPLPLFYLWYLNYTNLISWGTNSELELTNVQFAQSGAYSLVVSNALGAVTSSPAMLNVIAAVQRRPVPGVKVTGEAASLLNVDYANSLSPAPNWITLGSVSLASTSQYCFDLTLPLPPQRFYRAWQTGTPSVMPSLDLHLVPAITLTGTIGHSVRLNYINQYGPTDAWVTLETVTLTNSSQLYFDVSAPGQPPRLYRLVPLP